ncbi:CoxG family protein [Peribacillus huizhouensis]|uniref:Carbon monoxide dehydrogenase subunit G n=1 Tax=Peribacillus huizhouensis TaxID=1501239 RepID=A0ABR6CPQ4_9BACI|nr:SRPBCC family protein [Peribacillus huizhouensis]MBA9027017.1 carbon monoxide dehydrogenase subunit G [Peribacillus huizhouensis]
MASGVHSVIIPLSIENIWKFVSVIDNWAPLVPGYITHTVMAKNQSTWEFISDLGLLKKKVKLLVDITEWSGPEIVKFHLTGMNENFLGSGYFKAEMIDENKTKMTGHLDIIAKGLKAPMANSLLKSYVPETAKALAEAVAVKLLEIHHVAG